MMDIDILLFATYLFVILVLLAMAFKADNKGFLLPSGIVTFLLAFHVYTVTANIPGAIAVVALGLLLLAQTVIEFGGGRR